MFPFHTRTLCLHDRQRMPRLRCAEPRISSLAMLSPTVEVTFSKHLRARACLLRLTNTILSVGHGGSSRCLGARRERVLCRLESVRENTRIGGRGLRSRGGKTQPPPVDRFFALTRTLIVLFGPAERRGSPRAQVLPAPSTPMIKMFRSSFLKQDSLTASTSENICLGSLYVLCDRTNPIPNRFDQIFHSPGGASQSQQPVLLRKCEC